MKYDQFYFQNLVKDKPLLGKVGSFKICDIIMAFLGLKDQCTLRVAD